MGQSRAPVWAIVTIIALAVILAALSGLVLTGELNHLLGKDKVYISGVDETGTIDLHGTPVPVAIKLGCVSRPYAVDPGSTIKVEWLVQNGFSLNSTVTYTTRSVSSGSGWSGSVSPNTPLTLQFGDLATLTLSATAPATPGDYFVPIPVDATVS